MKRFRVAAVAVFIALAACGQRAQQSTAEAGYDPERTVRAINDARFTVAADLAIRPDQTFSAAMIKLQVLLDRARFSPGVIDGLPSDNLRRALMAFEQANGLPVDGVLDREVWTRLTGADQRPAARLYVIDPGDVAGPFSERIPGDLAAMARLDSLSYANPVEALAEAFHTDPRLLEALNPETDFSVAGVAIVVPDRGSDDLGVDIALVEVDSARQQVRAYAADQRLLAVYPATVGSARMASPMGRFEVEGVVTQPLFAYDTGRVTFGAGLQRRAAEIAPGPNNPVGPVWIQLSGHPCGLHGSPDPEAVGGPSRQGCVALTNWDVRELARGVREGTPVVFR